MLGKCHESFTQTDQLTPVLTLDSSEVCLIKSIGGDRAMMDGISGGRSGSACIGYRSTRRSEECLTQRCEIQKDGSGLGLAPFRRTFGVLGNKRQTLQINGRSDIPYDNVMVQNLRPG